MPSSWDSDGSGGDGDDSNETMMITLAKNDDGNDGQVKVNKMATCLPHILPDLLGKLLHYPQDNGPSPLLSS